MIHGTQPSSGYISEENKITVSKRDLYPPVRSSIIYNNQDLGTTYMSTDGWLDKEHTHTVVYYSAIKRKEILLFMTTWMELACILLSEIRER